MLYHSIAQCIGNTPLIQLHKIRIPNNNKIFGKCEFFNPAGSIKDRAAIYMLAELKAKGKLTKQSIIIEATAGNTGLGIALAAIEFGCKALLVIPEYFSLEKQTLIRALGAEIITTPKDLGIQGAIDKANELLSSMPHALPFGQFADDNNPKAHYHTTAHEIYRDMQEAFMIRNAFNQRATQSQNTQIIESTKSAHSLQSSQPLQSLQISQNFADRAITHFVCGAGSGGSFSGIAHYLKERDSRILAILCDPLSSVIGGNPSAEKSHIEGIGNNFIPKTMDMSLIDGVYKISDEEAYEGMKMLAKEEGILAGISSGACLSASLKLAQDVENARIVTIFADGLDRYLSRNLI